MPIYEYECEQCGVRFERLQKMMDAPLRECPECNGHIHRVMQPVGIIFKGSGFYVTDNKGKSSTGIPAKKEEPAAKAASTTSTAETGTASNTATPSPASTAQD